jgi:energy-converting hydrogenase Eha subunit F
VTSTDTQRGRHRLAEPVRRPALMPRSVTVVAATVGAVVVLGVQEGSRLPAPRPHPDAPTQTMSALEPVVPAQRSGRPARIDPAHVGTVPAGVTGRAIAGAHTSGFAPIRALDAIAATQPHGGIAPRHYLAA